MIILLDKKKQEGNILADATQVAGIMGLSAQTIRRRLPYWEDRRWVICVAEMMKSERGFKVGHKPLNKFK